MATITSSLILFVDAQKINALMHRGYTAADFLRFGKPPGPLEGFFTFFDPGLPLGTVADAETREGKIFPETPGLRKEQSYAKQPEKGRYRQLRIVPLQKTIGKSLEHLTFHLELDEALPSARALAIAKIIYFLANQGAKLWENVYAPSDTHDSNGNQIIVGGFLHIVTSSDRFNRQNLALISEKNLR